MIQKQPFHNSDANNIYKPMFFDQRRYQILVGGAGSGKSYFAAQWMLTRLSSSDKQRLVICRKTARTIRNSQYQLLKDVMHSTPAAHLYKCSDTRQEIVYTPNGNTLISTGLDDREKLKSLAAPSCIWIEEATELDYEDFKQLDLRLRGKDQKRLQIIMSFNPISKGHWLYKRFFVRNDADAHIIHSTYQDNKHIDEQYVNVLNSLKLDDANFHKVYALGEWGERTEGLIFQYKLVDEMPECEEYIYGIDFGFNNPSAIVEVGIVDGNYFARELIYSPGLTNAELIKKMQQSDLKSFSYIYADNAEPDRIMEIYRAGFNVKPAAKEVLNGIDMVKRSPLYVVRGSKNLIAELDTYSWKQDKEGHYLDSPEKQNDHACDALRYAIYTHHGKPVPRIHGFV